MSYYCINDTTIIRICQFSWQSNSMPIMENGRQAWTFANHCQWHWMLILHFKPWFLIHIKLLRFQMLLNDCLSRNSLPKESWTFHPLKTPHQWHMIPFLSHNNNHQTHCKFITNSMLYPTNGHWLLFPRQYKQIPKKGSFEHAKSVGMQWKKRGKAMFKSMKGLWQECLQW